MKEVQIGIGPIGWVNDDIRTWGAETPGQTVMAEMAAAGYVGSEMSYAYPQEPGALKATLAGHGLVLAAAYRWTNLADASCLEAEVAATCAHIDFCKAAGARFALVAEGFGSLHWDHRGERSAVTPLTDAQWTTLAEGLHRCGRYAREQGMTLAIHPHGGTAIETPAQIEQLLGLLDPELVGYCPDTAHITYGGGDPAAVLQQHRERIVYVHLKDVRADVLAQSRAEGLSFKQAVMQNVFCTPGAGSLDWQGILGALGDYKGWLIVEAEQDPAVHHAFTVSKQCRAFLREVGGV